MNERRKTLLKYVIPTLLASCSSFLYIIVDGIFVGQGVGKEALGAVNLALPFTLISTALGMLMTIGGITVAAIRLGRQDNNGANNAFMHAVTASSLIGLLLMLAGMIFAEQIAVISGANGTFLKMTADYIFYYSMFSLPFLISITLQGFVRNDGSPVLVSIAVISAAATNIILDWLFVFPLQMGIKGAAIASGLGQVIGLIILIFHFVRQRGVLRFKKFKLSVSLLLKLFKRGLPEMISQFGTPITTLCLNNILVRTMGDISVSAFSVMSYILSFSMGIFFGVAEGIQPLIGNSYGAKNERNLKYYFRSGILMNTIGSLLIYIVTSVFGLYICGIFNSDPVLGRTAAEALPKFGWSFLFIALNLTVSAYLYSTKRTAQAVGIAVMRCIILNSVIILFLPQIFGNEIIWYTSGIAEALSFIIAFILLKTSERNGVVFK